MSIPNLAKIGQNFESGKAVCTHSMVIPQLCFSLPRMKMD